MASAETLVAPGVAEALEECCLAIERLERQLSDPPTVAAVQETLLQFTKDFTPLRDEMSTDPESIAEDLSSKLVCVLSMMCPLLSSPSDQHSESDSRGNLSAALMAALALIIRHPRNHAAAQAAGGLTAAVEAMSAFPGVCAVQKAGCFLVRNIAFYTSAQVSEGPFESKVHAEMLAAVTAAMERFLDDPEMQRRAISALQNIAVVSEPMPIFKVASTGLFAAALRFMDVADVMVGVCNVYSALCRENAVAELCMEQTLYPPPRVPGWSADEDGYIESALAFHGGSVVQLMIECLQQMPPQLEVAIGAMKVLTQVAKHSTHHKEILCELGVLDVAATAMQQLPLTPAVHLTHATLADGLVGPTTRSCVLECGLVQTTLLRMREHPNCEDMQQANCVLLANLSISNELGKEQICEHGGPEAAVRAMDLHDANPDMQLICCILLSNIHVPSRTMQMIEAGTVEAVRRALQRFPNNAKLWNQVAKLLYRVVSRAVTSAREAAEAAREFAQMQRNDNGADTQIAQIQSNVDDVFAQEAAVAEGDLQVTEMIRSLHEAAQLAMAEQELVAVVVSRNMQLCHAAHEGIITSSQWWRKLQVATAQVDRQPWNRQRHSNRDLPVSLSRKVVAIILAFDICMDASDVFDQIFVALDATRCRLI